MPYQPPSPTPPTSNIPAATPSTRERLAGQAIDLLRKAGARTVTNAALRLARLAHGDKPANPPAHAAASAVIPTDVIKPPQSVTDHQAAPQGPFVPFTAAAPAVEGPPSDASTASTSVASTSLTPTLPSSAPQSPALLIFVPRSLRSRFIDAATGGYGYSHTAIDCGEIDQPTGRRVMIESAPGQPVRRTFLDVYGKRPYVRIPLAALGPSFDTATFCRAVKGKIGETYDKLEALTWGEVDDPAKQICSDLVTVCLPRPMLDDIARTEDAGRLPRRSVSLHHRGTPEFHAFLSPNALAAYFGAPPGERLHGPDQLVSPRGNAPQPSSIPFNVGEGLRRYRPLRAKLIYNPQAGGTGGADSQLAAILAAMQNCDLLTEVHIVTPASRLDEVARDAVRRGIRLIVVAGGDGTIDTVAAALAQHWPTPPGAELLNRRPALGIIPIGTRNNVAHSLGIPEGDVTAAVALLRAGHTVGVDMGHAHCDGSSRWFLEAGVVGLASALYPAADDLQHGDLLRVGDLVSTFVAAAPSRMQLEMDGGRRQEIDQGHLILIANMPYLGPRFHPSADVTHDDGQLDVFVFGGLGKLDLLSYVVQLTASGVADPRVTHYQARRVEVHTTPPMPAMVDGVMLGREDGSGALRITLHHHAVRIIAARAG